MKISKWVDMGQDVDIEIGVDDIRGALAEAFARVTEDTQWLGDSPPNSNDVVLALSNIGSFLRALTDAQIAMLNSKQRATIAKFLTEQAERFHVGGLFVPEPKGEPCQQ